jgi:hypothetical protein
MERAALNPPFPFRFPPPKFGMVEVYGIDPPPPAPPFSSVTQGVKVGLLNYRTF